MKIQTQYCLFFSFKGGVGRTSAMMNTARHLARQKKRVFCLDLDIAAPGIDIFDRIKGAGAPSYNPSKFMLAKDQPHLMNGEKFGNNAHIPLNSSHLTPYKKESPGGFLEFCQDYLLATNKNKEDAGKTIPDLPELSYPNKLRERHANYQQHREEDKYLFLLPKDDIAEGDIIMMRVCNHDDQNNFNTLLDGIDLNHLDPKLSTDMSELTKNDEPDFIYHFKHQIEEKICPDYVLIDGRPGMDPISKLAMTWFADCIVLAFNLNPWNLNGIIEVYKDRATQSPCQKNATNILLLASPIPEFAQRSDLYADQFLRIKYEMGDARNSGQGNTGGPIEVPQTDILLLRDILICDVEPQHPACRAYSQLADLIVAGNHQDVRNAIKKAKSMNNPSEVLIEFDRLERHFNRSNEAVASEHGKAYLRLGREEAALEHFKRAWDIIDEQRSDNKNMVSPYILDTAKHIAETRRIIAVKTLSYFKRTGLSFIPDWKTKLEEQAESLSSALKKLQVIKDLEGIIALRDITDSALAPYLALEASIHLLQAQLQMTINQEHNQDTLNTALEYYNKSIKLSPNNADYYFGRATVNLALAEVSSTAIEDAIKDFDSASQYQTGFADAMLKAGQYYFSLAVQAMKRDGSLQRYPTFAEDPPFVETMAGEYIPFPAGEVVLDAKRLELAEKKLTNTINQQSESTLAYFYSGLICLVKTLLVDKSDQNRARSEQQDLYKQAIGYFSSAVLYKPTFTPAYLYSGLAQFLLNNLDDSSDVILENIRFRQAFYRMEHFIELNFNLFVPQATGKDREPFYFDGEPGKHIDTIIASFKDDRYDFPLTLEMKTNLPSMVKVLRPVSEYRDLEDSKFTEMIIEQYVEIKIKKSKDE
jgi:tetratricopeptide (TPR) repeat protein